MRPDIQRLFDGGHYQETATALQGETRKDPQNSALHYWLGRSFYELRDYSHSISSLEQAVAIEPDNSDYHDWLGRAAGRKAEESGPFSALALARRTHREFTTAVRLDRTNLEAQRDLIRYLLNAPGILGGGEDRALVQIADLSVVDSTEGDLARADYFATRKQFQEAGEQYEKILQAKPKRIGVYLEIAEYFRDRADGADMQRAVDAAASVVPTDRTLDYYWGVSLVLSGQNPVEAERRLRSYLGSVPDGSEVPAHASAHEWLGKLYENERQLDRAAVEYQAALALDTRNKALHEALKRVDKK